MERKSLRTNRVRSGVQRAIHRLKDLTDRRQLLHSPEDEIEALNAFLEDGSDTSGTRPRSGPEICRGLCVPADVALAESSMAGAMMALG